jgi:hypothetical protein
VPRSNNPAGQKQPDLDWFEIKQKQLDLERFEIEQKQPDLDWFEIEQKQLDLDWFEIEPLPWSYSGRSDDHRAWVRFVGPSWGALAYSGTSLPCGDAQDEPGDLESFVEGVKRCTGAVAAADADDGAGDDADEDLQRVRGHQWGR